MKAITITKANQGMLVTRFGLEQLDRHRQLPIGYILVTDFGNDENFDVISPALFAKLFKKTGDIKNGFISIESV